MVRLSNQERWVDDANKQRQQLRSSFENLRMSGQRTSG
jgi:hypothetical protein